jgi:hypothetical protein
MSHFQVLLHDNLKVNLGEVLDGITSLPQVSAGIVFGVDKTTNGHLIQVPISLKNKLFPDNRPLKVVLKNASIFLFIENAPALHHLTFQVSSIVPLESLKAAFADAHVSYLRPHTVAGCSRFLTGTWYIGLYYAQVPNTFKLGDSLIPLEPQLQPSTPLGPSSSQHGGRGTKRGRPDKAK